MSQLAEVYFSLVAATQKERQGHKERAESLFVL